MRFAATQMQLQIIILREVRRRQTPYDITYMRNLECDTKDPIYETDIKITDKKNS